MTEDYWRLPLLLEPEYDFRRMRVAELLADHVLDELGVVRELHKVALLFLESLLGVSEPPPALGLLRAEICLPPRALPSLWRWPAPEFRESS